MDNFCPCFSITFIYMHIFSASVIIMKIYLKNKICKTWEVMTHLGHLRSLSFLKIFVFFFLDTFFIKFNNNKTCNDLQINWNFKNKAEPLFVKKLIVAIGKEPAPATTNINVMDFNIIHFHLVFLKPKYKIYFLSLKNVEQLVCKLVNTTLFHTFKKN